MRSAALKSALFCLAFSASASAQDIHGLRAEALYTVKQQGGGLGRMIDEIVVIQAVSRGGERAWIAERRFHLTFLNEQTFRHQWIDGRTCPALETTLAGIDQLPSIKFAGPKQTQRGGMIDVAAVTLIGPSTNGYPVAQTDLAGPISKWWADSAKALEPCWSSRMVLIGDGTVPAKLATDEDATAAGRLPNP